MTNNLTATQVFDRYLAGLNNRVREYYILVTTFAPSVSSQTLLENCTDNDCLMQIYALLVKYRFALINGGDIISVNTVYGSTINRLIYTYHDNITRDEDDGMFDSNIIDSLITLEAKHKK